MSDSMEQQDAILGQLVYSPKAPQDTRIARFRNKISSQYNISLPDYHSFWQWSCAHPAEFWMACWEEVDIIASQKADRALAGKPAIYPPPTWFPGAKLNVAENLLRFSREGTREDLLQRPALLQVAEPDPDAPENFHVRPILQGELRKQVAQAVKALRSRGVKVGDRVASYSSNCSANVIAFLATAAIGAIWVSSAADFAPEGVLERLQTVRPKVLFAVDGVRYNGRTHDHLSKVTEVVQGLQKKALPEDQDLDAVVIIPYLEEIGATSPRTPNKFTSWSAFLEEGAAGKEGEIDFEQLDFNHPLWILFSSGTTGKPKAIMHRAGGMLLQLAKEHLLHAGMTPDDVFLYFTTPGWMMWNYLVTGLITGAPLVLYDGSPLRPASTLWRLADQLNITIFGTSAAYLSALEKSKYIPRQEFPHLAIRQVLSTGSPLRADLYPWIMQAVGPDTIIGSITGGTDICSLFAGVNVELPVYAGEIQARNLGMDVDVFDDDGNPLPPGTGSGNLVCKTAFPAQPLGLFAQPEQRHFDTYYAQVQGVWYHGDFVSLSLHGGLVMLGRSDGILNAGGIRFGSSEIYDVLEKDRTADSASPLQKAEAWLVCALKTPKGDDEVVVLFMVVKDSCSQDEWTSMQSHAKNLIRQKRSARHVPRFVYRISGVPLTLNNKLAEVPAKKLVNGASLSSINQATLQNPHVLTAYVEAGQALRKQLLS